MKETRPFNDDRQKALKEGLTADPGPPTDAQVQAAEVCARFLVYRLTDPKFRNPKLPLGAMKTLLDQCEHWQRQIFLGQEVRNPQMQAAFRDKMLEALGHVLTPKDQQLITRINATRVLARLAAMSGHVETTDLLVKVLIDPDQVDGVRYWAMKGLKELLLRESQKPPAARMDANRREKIAQALVGFIERKPVLDKSTPEEELEGLRVMRREALRALALLPEPLFPKAQTALTLLRLLRQDKELAPEPRFDERLEAAIGLARMQPNAKYEPGYAAYHLVHFLRDCADRYAKRQQQTALQREPWKVHGARLYDAFRAMQVAFPNDPTVKEVAPIGLALGKAIEKDPSGVGKARENANKWLTDNPQPRVPSLYKGVKSELTPRVGPEAPPRK